MPCDSGMGGSSYDFEARRQVELLTRVSCDIMRALEASGAKLNVSHKTSAWWERHKRIYAEREQREQLAKQTDENRRTAIAKLTPAERAALGIKP